MEQWPCSMEGLVMSPDFWCKKRVLITGHTGFKGSWLSLWFQSLGANLSGLSLKPPTEPALFEVARVAEGMEHNIVDIRDFEHVKAHMDAFSPEIVFHMAAQPLVRLSYEQPLETYSTNVMGTVNVLEAARNSGSIKAIVNITTDKCYENREIIWGYREEEPMGGHDPYSSSKGCAELVSNAYRRSFLTTENISMATARAGNVIGGGDWALDRLVPDMLRAIEKNETIKIRNPNAVRPWQHVLEPISGYLTLAERLYKNGNDYAEGWNFGPTDEDARSVEWIVENFCQMWGNNANWIAQQGNHPHEANYLKLDISKARQRLQWEPRWSLNTALTQIAEWHKAFISGSDMHEKTLQQIKDYTKTNKK